MLFRAMLDAWKLCSFIEIKEDQKREKKKRGGGIQLELENTTRDEATTRVGESEFKSNKQKQKKVTSLPKLRKTTN